jgi:hypothetical protein
MLCYYLRVYVFRSTAVIAAVLIATGLFLARAQAEDILVESDVTLDLAKEVVLTAPFSAPRLNFFHSSLEVPPLESPKTLPPGYFYIQISSNHAHSKKSKRINGIKSEFDGLYHEWARADLSMGVFSWLDVAVSLALTGWDEDLDKFPIFDEMGRPIVRYEYLDIYGLEATKRHDNLSEAVIRAKAHLLQKGDFDLALASSLKIPFGRPRDLTNAGTYDVNIFLLGSYALNNSLTLYANCGAGFPLGKQNLFEEVADVDLNPFFQGGIGVNWKVLKSLAVGVQLEGNTSAFQDVEFLDYPALTLFAGVRKLFGRFYIEGGGGTGLYREGSYDYNIHVGVGYLFKAW